MGKSEKYALTARRAAARATLAAKLRIGVAWVDEQTEHLFATFVERKLPTAQWEQLAGLVGQLAAERDAAKAQAARGADSVGILAAERDELRRLLDVSKAECEALRVELAKQQQGRRR